MAENTILSFRSLFGKMRLDPEFYRAHYINNQHLLEKLPGVTTLGDITAVFRKGIFSINSEEYVEEGIPFVRIGDLKGMLIEPSGLAYITQERHSADWKTSLVKGDVVLSKTARPAASIVQLDECNVSQDIIAVKTLYSSAYNTCLVLFFNTEYGRLQLERLFQGNIQAHLSLEEAKTILVPDFSAELIIAVNNLFAQVTATREEADYKYFEAEALLLHTLQLDKTAPASKTYIASFSDFTRTLRLDAQYYQPRYQQTLDRLGKSGLTVASVAVPVRTRFRPVADTTFQYLEIGGLLDGGRVEPEPVAAEDAPSRAQTVLQVGDVVTSSVRPIRRLTGFIGPEQGGTVGTSGFIALRPTAVAPEVLTVYLRLPIVCEILDLYTTATMYPTITEADVLKLPFPALSPEVQREIVSLVQAGFAARQRATELLDEAKRRVEEFIKAS